MKRNTLVTEKERSTKPRSFSLNQVNKIKNDTQSFFIRKIIKQDENKNER